MVTHHHHSLLVDWDQAATAADALASTDEAAQPGPAPTGDAPADDVQAEATERAAHYWDYLRNRPDSITAALQVIASSRGATIVHCAAGKDRTGVVAALALEVAGVQSADIVADYVASAQRIGPILRRLQASEFYAADPHTYDVRAQTPTEASMQLFLGTLSRHGGARNWLCDHGWTQSELSALQAKLVG
ncbi:MAG: hypothetical protein CSB46_06040 [Micrococcales bacterium]|nr:MAG: hypothetical protein CSB46_06040 [Micrococcales bacterium]